MALRVSHSYPYSPRFPWSPPITGSHPQRLLFSAEGGISGGGFHHFGQLLSVPGPRPCRWKVYVVWDLNLAFSC